MFFNCIPWSDFAGESEMLFSGGLFAVEIIGLTEVNEGLNHDKWIKVLKIFSMLIQGFESSDRISNKDKDMINSLIDNVIGDNDNKNIKSIPLYVQSLFQHMLRKTTRINIDVNMWNKDVYRKGILKTTYGYQKIKHIYFDKKDNIKWNTFLQLYPSLENIQLKCYENIPLNPNQFKWAPSLLIDDNLLLNIYSYLCNVKDKEMEIIVCEPKNSKSSLESLINKHSEMYSALGYKLETAKTDSPGIVGTCDIFCINSKNKKLLYL
eukprot:158382_1